MSATDWVAEEEAWIMAGDESTFQEWLDRPRPSTVNYAALGSFLFHGDDAAPIYQQQLQAILNQHVGQPIYLNRQQQQRRLLSGIGGGLFGL